MKIIQSANTFGGERLACGFETVRAFQSHMQESVVKHLQLGELIVYVDSYSYETLKDIVPDENMELFDFKIELNDRLPYIGKFQVQAIQAEPYIHVDLDATVIELPESSDIYIWKYRVCSFLGVVANNLNISHEGIFKIPCSSVIGFSDISLKNEYISEVYSRFDYLDLLEEITYEHAYTLEEILLESLIYQNNSNVETVNATHKK